MHRLISLALVPLLSFGMARLDAQEKPASIAAEPLAGTAPLTMTGDIASQLVDGADRFLLRELELSVDRRAAFWKRDFSSPEAYEKSIQPNRARLAHILGVRDPRIPFAAPELLATTNQSALCGEGANYSIFAIRWPAVRDVHGEGLLLIPKTGQAGPKGDVIYLPDADQTPEQVCGLTSDGPDSSVPLELAAQGYRVVVPALISRRMVQRNGRSTISQREFVYRAAFELGRHLQGYEVQKTLALVDWLRAEAKDKPSSVRIAGHGEGGLLALLAGALDPRITEVEISGCFGNRQTVWQQPIDRNVFGLLEQFGDAELAAMIAPRKLTVVDSPGPTLELSGKGGGAPAQLSGPTPDEVKSEVERARQLVASFGDQWLTLIASATAAKPSPIARPTPVGQAVNPLVREDRQVHELNDHNQWLLRESEFVRKEFMKKLDTSSVDAYRKSVEEYRNIFRKDVIGSFDYPLAVPAPRSRKSYEQEKWTGYEVVLDVWPDVIAYGVLLLPKDLKPGEKRPVVVCQHGLEGRPQDVITGNIPAYHDFAAKLCERGFITFAPQNLYIFRDRFRSLQRKANPLKKTLFSLIVPQHQQIVNWLKTLPNVDPERIAFYGLSYGGKSAMRIPPLVTDYCLSICSADFNEWVAKNASTRLPMSYVWTGEYEIFEFDLGSTFNYAEMAALIAPRPFMVERGHTDGVSTDEWVAFEFAKVRYLYSHRLKQPALCEMEVFDGPHTINGQGTFDFLHKHLRWEKRD